MIKFKLEEGAVLPSKGSKEAAGYDIHCKEDVFIRAYDRLLVKTGVVLADCPSGLYIRIAPRSKLANKFGLDILAGVVDSDYRGELCVILQNHSHESVTLQKGTAIAQLIPTLLAYPAYVIAVEETREVAESQRGTSGIQDKDLRMRGANNEQRTKD